MKKRVLLEVDRVPGVASKSFGIVDGIKADFNYVDVPEALQDVQE